MNFLIQYGNFFVFQLPVILLICSALISASVKIFRRKIHRYAYIIPYFARIINRQTNENVLLSGM